MSDQPAIIQCSWCDEAATAVQESKSVIYPTLPWKHYACPGHEYCFDAYASCGQTTIRYI